MQLRHQIRRSFGALALVITWGCADSHDPARPLPAEASRISEASSESEAGTPDDPTTELVPLLELTSTVEGALQRGGQVILRAQAVAEADLSSASLAIWAPEIASAERFGWGIAYKPMANEVIPALARLQQELRLGQVISVESTIDVPPPGVYRLIFSARADPTTPTWDAISESHVVRWLVVDPDGSARLEGRHSESMYPTGQRHRPGPFQERTSLPTSGFSPAAGPIQPGRWDVYLHYLDLTAQQWRPLPDHQVRMTVFYRDTHGDPQSDVNYGYTNSSGYVPFDCDPSWERIVVNVDQDAPDFDFNEDLPQSDEYYGCDLLPQGGFQFDMDSDRSTILEHLKDAQAAAQGMFGLTAPTLKVRLVATGSSWDDDNNEIKLTLGGWWGVRAHSIIHHEYGHALHDLRLGGLPNLYNNECNPHAPGVITTYRCAFVEGFAEFFAEASGAAEPSWPLEPQQYYAPAPEGLKSEGAFAGFLLDIWDEAVEPWDGISYPGSWMAAVLRDCSIQWGGFWYSPHVPHWLASCMEDSTTAYGEGWFPLLEIPSAIITAQKPSGWSAAAVRSAYLHNFFNNTKD